MMNKNDLIFSKIYTPENLLKTVNIWRFLNEKIVFTNGCFDLLHLGHIDYLSKAASLGNRLIIGVNTDESTRKLKGPHRPITNQQSRSAILASLFFVDAIVLFDEPTPLKLIQTIQPNVLVKGADYSLDQIVGAKEVLSYGGNVETIEFLPGYSTSSIEQQIKQSS